MSRVGGQPVRFSERRCRWPVRLNCGHDRLVTDAAYYSRFTLCLRCVPDPAAVEDFLRTASRRIVRRLTLAEVPRS